MSEMLKKARAYEAEKAAQPDKNTICSTSIIHMQGSGDRCTGGTV